MHRALLSPLSYEYVYNLELLPLTLLRRPPVQRVPGGARVGGRGPHARPARPLPAIQRHFLLGKAVGLRGQVVAQDDALRRSLQLPKKIQVLLHQVRIWPNVFPEKVS